MVWQIELSASAEKSLARIGSEPARRVARFIDERLSAIDDPRSIGKALTGSRRGELWRYRVGDYRIVVMIEDKVVRILVVQIGHRSDIYQH